MSELTDAKVLEKRKEIILHEKDFNEILDKIVKPSKLNLSCYQETANF